MILTFGTHLFGKTDRLSNGWYFATKCFHICYFPLFPLSSWVVVEETRPTSFFSTERRSWRGVPIPLAMRPTLLAYARQWSLLLWLVAIILLPPAASVQLKQTALLVCIAFAVFIWLAFRKASPIREATLLPLAEAALHAHTLPPAARNFEVLPPTPVQPFTESPLPSPPRSP